MKYLYIICFSFIFMSEDSSVLVLKSQTDISPDFLDNSDINTINSLFVDGLKQYIKEVDLLDKSCSNNECALEYLFETNYDEVIYTRLQKLGTKIIFSASILDSENTFDSKATAMNIEDMEKVCLRLSKSIALRQNLDEAADVDNITEEDEEDITRRRTLGRIGLSGGLLIPMGDYTFTENNWDGTFTQETYSSLVKMNYTYYNEFKNNTAVLFEGGFAAPQISFMDLNFMKFENKLDTSPFYGGGVGYYNFPRDDDFDRSNGGISFNLQAGLMLYRTYNMNVMLRAKFVQVFNEDMNRALMFDVGLQWKVNSPGPRKDTGYTRVVNRYPILDIILDRN